VATPIGGGHYFVDVFAGIAIAVVAIVAALRIGQALTEPAALPFLPRALQWSREGGEVAK